MQSRQSTAKGGRRRSANVVEAPCFAAPRASDSMRCASWQPPAWQRSTQLRAVGAQTRRLHCIWASASSSLCRKKRDERLMVAAAACQASDAVDAAEAATLWLLSPATVLRSTAAAFAAATSAHFCGAHGGMTSRQCSARRERDTGALLHACAPLPLPLLLQSLWQSRLPAGEARAPHSTSQRCWRRRHCVAQLCARLHHTPHAVWRRHVLSFLAAWAAVLLRRRRY